MLHTTKAEYETFILSCRSTPVAFRLTPRSDPSIYATCFAIFGLHLIQSSRCRENARDLSRHLCREIRKIRKSTPKARDTKAFKQLLAFILSTLSILGTLDEDPLEDLVLEQIPPDVAAALDHHKVSKGAPQSGNHAMFLGIFLIHTHQHLGQDTLGRIQEWVTYHLDHMNPFGYWGKAPGMKHLLFQNGYHQHEIFEYLGIPNPVQGETLGQTRSLADRRGHFAPYPGGGGCYDYDAVFMLTPNGLFPDGITRETLEKTQDSILREQTHEGGWGESLYVRPRTLTGMGQWLLHLVNALPNPFLFYERTRYALALQRPKYNRIQTHWSQYDRQWNEADLWDSWFRMLAVARIRVALHPEEATEWGFIDFPGIGYHPSLKQEKPPLHLPLEEQQ